ncbi:competence type IV pilus ATPase ComGA [Halalkalibacter alkalisediminis]|uniref:Competence type IV pilus ATPase ComGA n=1 Tax=Halalkalibacter alkalisediminis TaxID=935616 RepID=A0ABV6NMF0_9BACI|nr:competence type IV pilus ATPase ComGA [Halalkalibacter alkalisediminis]
MYDIEGYSQQLINEALKMKVTDLHFIPDANHYLLTCRINGSLELWKELKPRLAERLISHFKYRCGMDIGERRKPQSSSMTHMKQADTFSLRFSTLPTKNNESLVIRILPHYSSKTLSSLSILQKNSKILYDVSSMSHGLCLISGPTGSGKTTTLYTIIEQMVRLGGRSIVAIEDPVERMIPQIVQVEVNERAGLTFNSLLTACLRHDPDVILIGEIRDEMSAALAVRASLTGHMVLATVHAQDCYTSLLRMLDLGVSRFDLMQCCKVVLSQRIISTKCPICQGECHSLCMRSRHMPRAAIYEVLQEGLLKECISSQSNLSNGFLEEINKAWALGYIEEKEWKRLAHDVF